MAERIGWRKAILVSLFLHGVVLTGVGWMAAKTFVTQDIQEQYMDLELVNQPDDLNRIAVSPVSGSMAANDSQDVTAAMSETKVNASSVSRAAVPSVQVSASSMSLLSAETSGNISKPEVSSGQGAGGIVSGGAGINRGIGAHSGSGTGTGKSGKVSGIISPGILSRVEPIYPEKARQAGMEGTVVLKIQILENGRSGYIDVYRSSGSSLLDNAAAAAVRQWRFTPAKDRDSGQAVLCVTTMPVVFRLKF